MGQRYSEDFSRFNLRMAQKVQKKTYGLGDRLFALVGLVKDQAIESPSSLPDNGCRKSLHSPEEVSR